MAWHVDPSNDSTWNGSLKFKLFGFKFSLGRGQSRTRKKISARYDAAVTDSMTFRHWANADGLSADQADDPEVRRVLRNRSRYELANNSYLQAMVDTMADAVIGSGPRLNFLDEDPKVNEVMELLFNDWFRGIAGPDKLLTGYNASVGQGETFFIERNNPNPQSPVTLDYRLVEADRCTSGFSSNTLNNIDGVLIDDEGDVTGYTFSKRHPGDRFGIVTLLDGDLIVKRPDQVIHFYKLMRPEQHRGIPEVTSSLPIGARMRDFVQSTADAARIASKFTAVIKSQADPFDDVDSPGGDDGDGEFDPLDTFTLENGQMLTLPKGWDMTQAKAEHPNTTFSDFKKELVTEMARSLGMPYNVAAGTSEGFNFASGKLDSMGFDKNIQIRQDQVNRRIMWPMFQKWFAEARVIDLFLPDKVKLPGYIPRFNWFYDGRTTIDQQKEAKANEINLKDFSDNLPNIYAKKGLDYRVEFQKIADSRDLMKELDIETEFMEQNTGTNQPPSAEDVAQAMIEQGFLS